MGVELAWAGEVTIYPAEPLSLPDPKGRKKKK